MAPTLGRSVYYRLTEIDALAIHKRREDARRNAEKIKKEWPGFQVHVGNHVSAGEIVPMTITTVWPNRIGIPENSVNGQALLDGNDSLWVTSAAQGDGPGQWSWPPRDVPLQVDEPADAQKADDAALAAELGTDATKWAKEFCDRFGAGTIAKELMLSWFANAIEAGRSAGLECVEERKAAKDQAYLERNHLVAALARLYPSGIARTDIPDWDEEWHGIVFIDLPSGQISYHYHDSQAHLFQGLPAYPSAWDGHDKDMVHQRLGLITEDDNGHG